MSELDTLLSQLRAADAGQREAAARGLGELARKGLGADAARGAEVLGRLLKTLADDTPEVQHAASTAAGWLAERGVVEAAGVPTVIALLSHEVGMVRHDAAWILDNFALKGEVLAPAALPLLLDNLGHENEDTRAATVYCLGTYVAKGVAGADVRARLEGMASDESQGVREAVGRVLG